MQTNLEKRKKRKEKKRKEKKRKEKKRKEKQGKRESSRKPVGFCCQLYCHCELSYFQMCIWIPNPVLINNTGLNRNSIRIRGFRRIWSDLTLPRRHLENIYRGTESYIYFACEEQSDSLSSETTHCMKVKLNAWE